MVIQGRKNILDQIYDKHEFLSYSEIDKVYLYTNIINVMKHKK